MHCAFCGCEIIYGFKQCVCLICVWAATNVPPFAYVGCYIDCQANSRDLPVLLYVVAHDSPYPDELPLFAGVTRVRIARGRRFSGVLLIQDGRLNSATMTIELCASLARTW